MSEPAKTLDSQPLREPDRTLFLTPTDPSLDAPLPSNYGGLDYRMYNTGETLFHDGTVFHKIGIENIGDILITDSTRNAGVKYTSKLTTNINHINTLNIDKVDIQSDINTLNSESSSIGPLITLIAFDKQQLQNKINSLSLAILDQINNISNINILITNLQILINNSNITLDDLLDGISTLNTRISNVENQYILNNTAISNLASIIALTQNTVLSLSITSTVALNKLINSDFMIWQRRETYGPGILNTPDYITADRWHHSASSGGLLTSQKTAVTTPEGVLNGLKINITGNSSPFILSQFLEGVDHCIGDMTLQLYLVADSNLTLTINIYQNFGSGGDPEVLVTTANFNVTTTVTQFSHQYTLPNINSNNIGPNSYIKLSISGSTWNNVILSRIQIHESHGILEFEERTYDYEFELCKRYYEIGFSTYSGYSNMNESTPVTFQYKTKKRIIPNIFITPISQLNYTNISGIGPINTVRTGSLYRTKSNVSNFGSFVSKWASDAEIYI